MVSKHYTILSLLLPVAMVIGTSFAIYAYQQSNKLLTMMIYIFGFIILCIFVVMTIQSLKKNNSKNYISK
jgi:flagellar biogenesis protein FliO